MFIDYININVEKFDLTRVFAQLYLCSVKNKTLMFNLKL